MTIQLKNWSFEFVRIKGRKTNEFGKPFTAVLDIIVVNGEVHIEGLLSLDKPNKEDIETVNEFIKLLGYSYYIKSYLKDGQRIREKVNIWKII